MIPLRLRPTISRARWAAGRPHSIWHSTEFLPGVLRCAVKVHVGDFGLDREEAARGSASRTALGHSPRCRSAHCRREGAVIVRVPSWQVRAQACRGDSMRRLLARKPMNPAAGAAPRGLYQPCLASGRQDNRLQSIFLVERWRGIDRSSGIPSVAGGMQDMHIRPRPACETRIPANGNPGPLDGRRRARSARHELTVSKTATSAIA